MANEKQKNELAALRAKRKPALTEAEAEAKAEAEALASEIEAEKRALRAEENADIVAKHAPNASRAFLDFDPDCLYPAMAELDGKMQMFHTRFVVRGATADMLESHGDCITAQIDAQTNEVTPIVDLGKQLSVLSRNAIDCIVWPTAAECGVTEEVHKKNLTASLHALGSARVELGKTAIAIGTKGAQARNSKS
jgi:hypothetical protein